ncbi:LOW QUALITY PROTEIN: Fc receptor-like protein 3 [Theristicus caerulescens]
MQTAGGPASTQQRARMARSAALLLWAQALGLTGAQPSQVTLDPPWTPVSLKEKVTLTCGGSGVPGPTDWYVNEQYWWQSKSNRIHISGDQPESSSYRCRVAGAELSPAITLNFSNDWLMLQVPARALLEGDVVSLRCRGWKDAKLTKVQFFHEQKALGGPSHGAELLLPPLQLHHSGHYRCQATLFYMSWEASAWVTVTVQELFSVPVLRLEGPAEPPEGTPLALSCFSHPSPLRPLTRLQYLFYRDEAVVGGPQGSPQLQLPAVGLQHSGGYSCEVQTETASVRKRSAPVAVTVRRVPVSGVSLLAQPPRGQVAEGDRLVLSCSVAAGTGPLSFSWHRQGLATPLATGPRYELHAVQRQDGGRYHCTATNGGTAADSPPLWVTVLVPVAGATITMARVEPSVLAGESLNLSCSVRAGTAPVTFTWLRDGQELGAGPVLSLEAVEPAHAGTYQCLATNRLGTRRIFRVLSPALALSVMQPERRWQRRDTDVAVGLSVSLLLLLLLGAAVAWHLRCRHRAGTLRPPPEPGEPEPRAPPEAPGDGEVLYAHVVPPVTYAVLPGPGARLRLPSDAYENVP